MWTRQVRRKTVAFSRSREGDGVHAIGQAQHLARGGGVEGGDPAGAQTQAGSGQDQVIHDDGRVHIGVVLAVRAADPALGRDPAGADVRY